MMASTEFQMCGVCKIPVASYHFKFDGHFPAVVVSERPDMGHCFFPEDIEPLTTKVRECSVCFKFVLNDHLVLWKHCEDDHPNTVVTTAIRKHYIDQVIGEWMREHASAAH